MYKKKRKTEERRRRKKESLILLRREKRSIFLLSHLSENMSPCSLERMSDKSSASVRASRDRAVGYETRRGEKASKTSKVIRLRKRQDEMIIKTTSMKKGKTHRPLPLPASSAARPL
jgi:hypothetical protein